MMMMQKEEQNTSDSIDLELLIQEQKKKAQLHASDQSSITAEFMNREDDPDNDEMAQIISKKVDPFNINHKKNQNLYRDTLLECIGLKPYKMVKSVQLPSFYVMQHKKAQMMLKKHRELFENIIQVCDPNQLKEQKAKKFIKDKIDTYVKSIGNQRFEVLNYLK